MRRIRPVTKWIRALTLAGVFAVGAGTVVTTSQPVALANSQKTKAKEEQKKPDDAKKPEDPKKPATKGTVVISVDAQKKFRFKVVGEDDKTIMQCSKGYETKDDALKALETAKAILNTVKPTEEK
jgi:uncharacterized protein YegP (UPF0339 family)